MERTRLADLKKKTGQEVTVSGWVQTLRSSGKIWFLILRDGSGYAQCVAAKGSVPDEVFELGQKLTQESSVTVTGTVREDKRAVGGYEVVAVNCLVHQIAEEFPITKKEHGASFLLDHRHLWLRSKKQRAILKVRHEVIRACTDFLNDNGFLRVDTPIFTGNACEGTTTLFETDYFGRKAYLSQSGQLYSEAAIMALGRTYCFGPTFRAEKSKTRRHLTEFWMLEPEIAFCDLEENMLWAERILVHLMARILDTCRAELETLERNTGQLEKVRAPFPRISYSEAVKILHEAGEPFEWGGDFGGGHETVISAKFDAPVIVHRFPSAIKAFYMKHDSSDNSLALGMDVLAPEGFGEIIGGGQREDDLETLSRRIREAGLPEAPFQWYLDLRRYGSVPHSGFGMGLERCVAWICGLEHLREASAFPRMIYRLEP